MFEKFKNRYIFSGTLTCERAIHIGRGASLDPVGTDNPVIKDVSGKPFIPGSSFKGALRAAVERIMQSLDEGFTCEAGSCVSADRNSKLKDVHKGNDEAYINALLKETCKVCKVFGSPWIASKVKIKDLSLKSPWFGQFEVRDGVSIDRDTETAAEGKKFDYEAVPKGTEFELEIVAENIEDEELGLLFVGLNEFKNGSASLGGNTSRGLGSVSIKWDKIEVINEDKQSLINYIKEKETTKVEGEEKIQGFIKDKIDKFINPYVKEKNSDA
jgi:CRISPR-associated RAMP protein (TIGR02581 family)